MSIQPPQSLEKSPINSSNISELNDKKETIQVKILALWFILTGVFGFIIVLFAGIAGIAGFMTLSRIGLNAFYPIVNTVFFFGGVVTIGFMAIMAFKISSALHKLEFYGYQSALIFLSAMAAGSLVIALITFLFTKQLTEVISGIVFPLIDGLFLLLLRSQKQLFTSEKITSSLKTKTIIALTMLFVISLVGIYTQAAAKSYKEEQLKKFESDLEKQRQKYLQDDSGLNQPTVPSTSSSIMQPTSESTSVPNSTPRSVVQPTPMPIPASDSTCLSQGGTCYIKNGCTTDGGNSIGQYDCSFNMTCCKFTN